MQEKLARLSFNESGWRHPIFRSNETADSDYIKEMGFGNEDWLFRDEWEIGGWRYAFLQGVNKSRSKLLKQKEAFNVLLFTVNPLSGERFYVARIEEVECLTPDQAHAATLAFKERGWLGQMRSEISGADGNPEALGNGQFTDDIVNVRYRLSKTTKFISLVQIPENDPVVANWKKFTRFQLFNVVPESLATATAILSRQRQTRTGHENLPNKSTYLRNRSGGFSEVSLEHLQMQRTLVETLRNQFPQSEVLAEEDYMDVIVSSGDTLSIYEIKSDMNPLSVIRQAIGQLLEYAFFRSRPAQVTKLFIVGRRDLDDSEMPYMEFLKKTLRLPVEYVTVKC